MNILDRMFPKLPQATTGAGSGPTPAPQPAAARGAANRRSPSAGPPDAPVASTAVHARPELVKRRDQLQQQFAESQWNLGGVAYEMAIRDHFRLDVLVRLAARLQHIDGELGEVERLLRLEHAGAAGDCPGCGALHSHGAVYCWQCGANLIPQATVAARPVEAA
jgi:hypothetical protein